MEDRTLPLKPASLGGTRMFVSGGWKGGNQGKCSRKNPLRNTKKGQEKRDWQMSETPFVQTGGLVDWTYQRRPAVLAFVLPWSQPAQWNLMARPSQSQGEATQPEFSLLVSPSRTPPSAASVSSSAPTSDRPQGAQSDSHWSRGRWKKSTGEKSSNDGIFAWK